MSHSFTSTLKAVVHLFPTSVGLENGFWKQPFSFLLSYRTTPRSTSNQSLEVTWLWWDTHCCLLRTNSHPHNPPPPSPPKKKRKIPFILCERKSVTLDLIQLEKGTVLNFEFPRLMLFILRLPCFCHRSRVQYPLSQHLICIQSFSLLFLQSSL